MISASRLARYAVVVTVVCGWVTTARPVLARAYEAAVSVASVTYTQGVNSPTQTITVIGAGYLRITMPASLGKAVLSMPTCTESIEDTVWDCSPGLLPDPTKLTIQYHDGTLAHIGAQRFTVAASVPDSDVSASGTFNVAPKADVVIYSFLTTTTVMHLNVGNLGPSGAAGITVRLMSYPKATPGPLPNGCSWSGADVVCAIEFLNSPVAPLGGGWPSEVAKDFVAPLHYTGTVTATTSGRYADPDQGNNTRSINFGTPPGGNGGGTGGGGTGGGVTSPATGQPTGSASTSAVPANDSTKLASATPGAPVDAERSLAAHTTGRGGLPAPLIIGAVLAVAATAGVGVLWRRRRSAHPLDP
jgi:hypothetical protein